MRKYLLGACVSSLIFSSCELNTFPEGGTITEDQKQEVIDGDPSLLSAEVNALYSDMIIYDIMQGSGISHFDFGYASACIMWECTGQDMSSPNTGYNWYSPNMLFTDRVFNSSRTEFLWKTFYKQIRSANNILLALPKDKLSNQTSKNFRGQALAARAFDYLQLIQMLQFTYIGHEDALGVPLVTEDKTFEQLKNNPRAKVKDVYALILSDLNEAIELLTAERPSKDVININVAYGLRARANLLMGNWDAAATDADKAMQGYTPYSLADVNKPTFNSANSSSWIWGNLITPNNDVVKSGILNWPSMLCSFTGNGYTTAVGCFKSINQILWEEIPETDVRKGWWVDEDLKSPLINDMPPIEYKGQKYPVAQYFEYTPYVNVKFGAYQDIVDNATNASDWCLMRAEEMILIKAEALAMAGKLGEGKQVLESFVQTYRDPSFISKAGSAETFRDEVWFQRRIELWGEGFSFFDLLRLKKPLERVRNGKSNFPAEAQYNLPAESQIFLYLIPEAEIQTNEGITMGDNNPIVPAP